MPWLLPATGTGWRPAPRARPGASRAAGGRSERRESCPLLARQPSGALPLVLVHGLAVSHRYLMPLAAELAGHHPVHVVDLSGFGLSGDPGRVLGVAEHADHLAAWLEAGGLPPVAMLGNSFGCQIAVELAVRHPDRVAGLVLVGPTMDSSARTAPW